MNFLSKTALSTIAMAMVLTPAAALTANATRATHNQTKQDSCRNLNRSQQKIVDKIYFGNSWQVAKFQSLTNQKNAKNCKVSINSFEYLKRFGNFENLVAALKYTGLDATVAAAGTNTVFAPTDDAFAKLPKGLVQELLTNPAQKSALKDILLYHVVAGASVDAATATTLTSATMANGKTVAIKSVNGKLFLNNSQVVLYDIKTTNGIIHVIDSVLVPAS